MSRFNWLQLFEAGPFHLSAIAQGGSAWDATIRLACLEAISAGSTGFDSASKMTFACKDHFFLFYFPRLGALAMDIESAVFLLGAYFHRYWSSYLALIFPCLGVFVPRLKRMLKPAKFTPSRIQTGRNRGEKRRLLRDLEKEKKREARASNNAPCKGQVLRMKKGNEMEDSTYEFAAGMEGVMRDGAEGAGGAVTEGMLLVSFPI